MRKLFGVLFILVIPFFYAQSFYEINNRWAWKDYSHGDMGILEAYVDNFDNLESENKFCIETYKSLQPEVQLIVTSSNIITRQFKCLCHSGNKFRNCHSKAFEGLKKLKKNYMKQNGLD